MRKFIIASALACVLSAWLGIAVAHAQDVTLTVCKRNNPPTSCYETIQAAIDAAPPSGGTIVLPPGIYTERDITVNKSVTIQGQGPLLTIVQAGPGPCNTEGRVFSVSGVNVHINNLTIRNGCTTSDPSKPNSGQGGGIWSSSTLYLNNVVVRDNIARSLPEGPGGSGEAVVLGGGIYSVGYLRLENSSVYNNVVQALSGEGSGGGWYNLGEGDIINSTVADNLVTNRSSDPSGTNVNSVPFTGGGIENDGVLNVEYTTVVYNSVISASSGDHGAGIQNNGSMTLRNSLMLFNDTKQEPDIACRMRPGGDFGITVRGSNFYSLPPGCGISPPILEQARGIMAESNGLPYYIPPSYSAGVDGANCVSDESVIDQIGNVRPLGPRCDSGALEINRSYLTMASKGGERPNLVVQSISVNPPAPSASGQTSVSVVIANVGTVTSTSSFWVDLYVNPKSAPPTYAGTPWSQLCTNQGCNKNYGVAWRVTSQIGVGESLTLQTVLPGQSGRPDIYIVPQYSKWPNRLPAGNYNVWAVVDSWGGTENNIFGYVYEWNEFDNRGGPLYFYVAPAAVSSAAAAEEAGGDDQPIPPRVEPTNP